MALDPGSTPRSVIEQQERDRVRDIKAMEDRIVNAVVARITRELDRREKDFIDKCKASFSGSETVQFFEPIQELLTQMNQNQSLIVDKIDNMFAAISEQLQKKRPSLVDFQLGGTQKEPVGMTWLELSRQLISTATAPFTCFTPVIAVELDRIIIECKEPTSEKLDGSRMLRRLFSVIGEDHLNKVIYLLDHKDKTVIKPLKDLQHFHDWSKTAKQVLATVPVPEGFKITDMRGSPVVVRSEVHAENMQSLMDKGDTETTSDLSNSTTPVPTSSLQVDMTSVKKPIGYNMLDLSDDLKDFNICYQFHNFDLTMNEYGSTSLVIKDGELDVQSVKQLLDNYISVNAIHTEPSVNSWVIDKRFISIRKEDQFYAISRFKDFINLVMLDTKATPLALEPQKPMTLLDLFSVQKRKELDEVGTLFNMFTISFDSRKSQFILTKNNNVGIRSVDVIRCINNSIESKQVDDNITYPVMLETKEGETSKFIPLVSMKQMAEWLVIKPHLTTQQELHQSTGTDKQQSTPPSGTFPVAAYGVNRTLTVR